MDIAQVSLSTPITCPSPLRVSRLTVTSRDLTFVTNAHTCLENGQ